MKKEVCTGEKREQWERNGEVRDVIVASVQVREKSENTKIKEAVWKRARHGWQLGVGS